jgi:hypothetical protein
MSGKITPGMIERVCDWLERFVDDVDAQALDDRDARADAESLCRAVLEDES